MNHLKPGEQRTYQHSSVGQFVVRRWFGKDHPKGRPYFVAGQFYKTENEAVRGFDVMTRLPSIVEDSRYARAEGAFGEEE